MNRRQLLFISVAFWCFLVLVCAKTPRTIAVKEARELARAAVSPSSRTARGFGLEAAAPSRYFPEFYFFQAIWASPHDTSPSLGFYAVDRKTGDVWDANACREHTSQELKQLQTSIRKRIGLADEDYKRLRRKGPECE